MLPEELFPIVVCSLLQLDASVFPKQPNWNACNGSLPHLRGYPCALWMLMHTLTILTLPLQVATPTSTTRHTPTVITSTQALGILEHFIKNFFTCEVCRQHFVALTALSPVSVGSSGDAILWLWQAHNLVSARLEREGGGDPRYPKTLFPSHTRCPYCYHWISYDRSHDQLAMDDITPTFNNTDLTFKVGNKQGTSIGAWSTRKKMSRDIQVRRGLKAKDAENLEYTFVWNRTAVLFYLWNFYHIEYHWNGSGRMESRQGGHQQQRLLLASILQAAWPRRFTGQAGKVYDWQGERALASSTPEDSLCALYYMVCVVVTVFVGLWLYRKRRCKHFLRQVVHRRSRHIF